MQKFNLQCKDKATSLKDAVLLTLKLRGFEHVYSESDFQCFKRNTKGKFNQAFEIAELFITENQNTINDYSSVYEN